MYLSRVTDDSCPSDTLNPLNQSSHMRFASSRPIQLFCLVLAVGLGACRTTTSAGPTAVSATTAAAGQSVDLSSPDYWLRQGMELNRAGRTQEALDAFLEATLIDPDNAFAFFNLGTAAALLRRYQEAINALSRAVRINPDLLPAWNNLGAMYNLTNQPKEALTAFRQVTRLSPQDANAHYQCGLALITLGNRDGARREYETLTTLDPDLATQLMNKLTTAPK